MSKKQVPEEGTAEENLKRIRLPSEMSSKILMSGEKRNSGQLTEIETSWELMKSHSNELPILLDCLGKFQVRFASFEVQHIEE